MSDDFLNNCDERFLQYQILQNRSESNATISDGTDQESDFRMQLLGYRLTTAEILYYLPDYPDFLQIFIWQKQDLAPEFPVLKGFLDYWDQHIEGKLHSVRLESQDIISPAEIRHYDFEYHV